MNTIKEDLSISLDEKSKSIKNKYFLTIQYIGSIYGMVELGDPISKEDTFTRLEHARSIDDIIEIVRYIVGDVWLFIKDTKNVYLLSSTLAPPYYFYQKKNLLFFTKLESEICNLAVRNGEKISSYDFYDILTTRRSNPSLYSALFQNIIRIPNGHCLEIGDDLSPSFFCYLGKKTKYKMKTNYRNFKKVLEAIAKLYVDSGKKIKVYFSGGLDSFVIYLAFKTWTSNVTPLATHQEFNGSKDAGQVMELVQISKEQFDIHPELICAGRYSPALRKIRDEICKLKSTNSAKWDSYVHYSIMDKYRDAKDSLFFTGTVFDSAYGIEHTKMYTNMKAFATGWIKRYFFTKLYQRHLNCFLNIVDDPLSIVGII